MSWPTPQDYNEAVQNPRVTFSDPELKAAQADTNHLGLPMPMTGAFASVYRFHCRKRDVAVRCFLQNFQDRQERYKQISEFIMSDNLPYTVDFELIEKGILVHGKWHPILKMDWLDGIALDRYVALNYGNSPLMKLLLDRFVEMIGHLAEAGIAHGDLQHGNVLVCGDHLRLVDYDNMYVPALAGSGSHELGHRNYQHPGRSKDDFGPYLDDFSAWLIAISLFALSIDRKLWQSGGRGDDCLLFKREDLLNPDDSRMMQLLINHESEAVRDAGVLLREMLNYAPRQLSAFKGLEYTRSTLAVLKSKTSELQTLTADESSRRRKARPINPEEEWWNQHLSDHEENNNLALERARKLFQQKQYRDVSALVTQIIRAGRGVPDEAYFLRASSNFQLGNFKQASDDAEVLRSAIKRGQQKYTLNFCCLVCEISLTTKQWGKAETTAESWLKLAPHDPAANLVLVICYSNTARFKQAVEKCGELISQGYDTAIVRVHRAKALLKLKQVVKAQDDLNEALNKNPNFKEALVARSQLKMEAGHYAEAVSDINAALQQGIDIQALVTRAEIYLRQGDFSSSLVDFQQAIQLSPQQQDKAEYLAEAGVCLYGLKRYAESVSAFDDAFRNFSKLKKTGRIKAAMHGAAGYLALEQGKYEQAIHELGVAETATPDAGYFDKTGWRAYLGQGLAYAKMLQPQQAWKYFKRCHSIDDPDALLQMCRALKEMGQPGAAEDQLSKIITQFPDYWQAYSEKAAINRERRNWQRASLICNEFMARFPNNSAAHLETGKVAEAQHVLDKAALSYEQAIALNPNALEARVRLAHVMHKRGDRKAATNQYQLVLNQSPFHKEALLSLGLICLNADMLEPAMELFTQCVNNHPAVLAGWLLKARLHARLNQTAAAISCYQQINKLAHGKLVIMLEYAQLLTKTGDYQAAKTALLLAYSRNAKHKRVLTQMGQLRLRMLHYEEAARSFRAVLHIKPMSESGWSGLRQSMRGWGREQEYLDLLNSAEQAGTISSSLATYQRGMLLLSRREYEKALHEFIFLQSENPNDPFPPLFVASALRRMGRTEEAMLNIKASLDLDAQFAPAFASLGALAAQADRNAEALGYYRKARTLRPDWFGLEMAPYYRLLAYRAQITQPDVAFACLNESLFLDADDPDTYFVRGSLYWNLEKYDLAAADFMSAANLNPNYGSAFSNAGRCYLKLNWQEKAATAFLQAAELNPRDFEARFYRGQKHWRDRNFVAAIEDFMVSVNKKQYEIQSRAALAELFLERKEPDKAKEHALQVLHSEPDNLKMLAVMHKAWTKLGEPMKGLEYLNKGVGFSEPGQPVNRSELAELYCERGYFHLSKKKLDKALKDFNQSLKVDPDNTRGNLGAARAFIAMKDSREAMPYLETIFLKKDKYHIEALELQIQCLENLRRKDEAAEMRQLLDDLKAGRRHPENPPPVSEPADSKKGKKKRG